MDDSFRSGHRQRSDLGSAHLAEYFGDAPQRATSFPQVVDEQNPPPLNHIGTGLDTRADDVAVACERRWNRRVQIWERKQQIPLLGHALRLLPNGGDGFSRRHDFQSRADRFNC